MSGADKTAEFIETAVVLVCEAWDDGNGSGLDGWVGPGRGAGEVDAEAQHARTRMVHKADRLLSTLAAAGLLTPSDTFASTKRSDAEREVSRLNNELGAQLALRREAAQQVERVRALHQPWDDGPQPYCTHDREPWPCPTERALGAR